MTITGAIVRLSVYAALVFALAPGVATVIFHGLESVGSAPPPLHELTADCLKLLALLGLVPLLRSCGQRGASAWGWALAPGAAGRLMGGALLGVVSIGVTLGLLLAVGVRVAEPDLDVVSVAESVVLACLIAAAVSLIEETWFRGALPSVLAPIPPHIAVVVIATIYAALHFVRPDLVVPRPEHWFDAWRALGGMFDRMGDAVYLDGFVALLAAGLVLGLLRHRTGDVMAAVGCHAGWVFGIQLARGTTDSVVPGVDTLWVSSYDGVIGWPFVVVLAATACVMMGRFVRPESPVREPYP